MHTVSFRAVQPIDVDRFVANLKAATKPEEREIVIKPISSGIIHVEVTSILDQDEIDDIIDQEAGTIVMSQTLRPVPMDQNSMECNPYRFMEGMPNGE